MSGTSSEQAAESFCKKMCTRAEGAKDDGFRGFLRFVCVSIDAWSTN